jgi:hypothetical protein
MMGFVNPNIPLFAAPATLFVPKAFGIGKKGHYFRGL